MTTVSLCLIARNESAVIGRCLASVREVVDEMIVLDTGSTDDTADAARAAGARVESFPWTDDFAAARNASLDRAASEWVIVLDADEALAPESAPLVRRLIESDRADAWQVVMRNLQPPGEMLRYVDGHVVRLFRRDPAIRFRGAIHESVDLALAEHGARVLASPLVVLHDGYARHTVQGGESRAARNIALLERAVARDPDDRYLQFQLGVSCRHAGKIRDAQRNLQGALAAGGEPLSVTLRAEAQLRLAQLALGEKRYGSAAAYAQRTLEADDSALLARVVLGLALAYLGRRAEAVPHLERALAEGDDQLAVANDLRALLEEWDRR